jgi:hypothetical protein
MHMLTSARAKYGGDADRTFFPARVFEFVESSRIRLLDGTEHLWDLRVQSMASPGECLVEPCQLRICPGQYDPLRFSRDSAVSNTSGRIASIEFQRSPLADAEQGNVTLLESIGISPSVLNRMLDGVARWCENAIAFAENSVRSHSEASVSNSPDERHIMEDGRSGWPTSSCAEA